MSEGEFRSTRPIPPQSAEDLARSMLSLEAHRIELEMQNDELLKTQESLRDSQARFYDFYHLSPDGFLTLGEKDRILEANLSATTMLGMGRAQLLEQPFTRFIHPDDQDVFYLFKAGSFEEGVARVCELRLRREEGRESWARVATTEVKLAGGGRELRVTLSDITERKQAESDMREALMEKEALVRELFHRTRNNMQTILALLSLAGDAANNPVASRIIQDTCGRILSMSLVHKKLYESRDLSQIDLKGYSEEFLQTLRDDPSIPWDRVSLKTEIEQVSVMLDTAIPFGLVLHELVLNAILHAFPGDRRGEIRVRIAGRPGGRIELDVCDNGVGMPEGFESRRGETVGLQLVQGLVEDQLGGTLLFESLGGLSCHVRIAEQGDARRV